MDEQLDPSIIEFKRFINQYPQLCKDIQRKKVDVQSIYEKWVVLGADDLYWNKFISEHPYSKEDIDRKTSSNTSQETTSKSDIIQTLMQATENVDMTKVQSYVEQVSAAVNSVQDVVRQFNDTKNKHVPPQKDIHQTNPFFQWMKD